MNATQISNALTAEWIISADLCEQIAAYPEIAEADDIDAVDLRGDIIISVNGREVLRVDLETGTVERT